MTEPVTIRTGAVHQQITAAGPAKRPTLADAKRVRGLQIDVDHAWREAYPGEVKVHVVLENGRTILLTMCPAVAAAIGAALTTASDAAATPEHE